MTRTRSSAQRVQRRREKLRAAGLRPLQIWVPDTRAPGFAAECARQARILFEAEDDASRTVDEAWFETSDKTGWTV